MILLTLAAVLYVGFLFTILGVCLLAGGTGVSRRGWREPFNPTARQLFKIGGLLK